MLTDWAPGALPMPFSPINKESFRMKHVQIIGEVGSNYDGSLEKAKAYIQALKECGADAVKFQTLRKETLIAPRILFDGKWQANPVYEKFSNLELPDEWHYELKAFADQCGIEFFSSPFYLEAVDLLEKVGVKTYKIASGDITFDPLLKAVGGTGKKIILSTGASSLKDVERAIYILKKSGAQNIVLLHCVSNYPPDMTEMNLNAIATLKQTFKIPVGVSDHTIGSVVPLAAVALGATVIEKHVTFDHQSSGPDHPFATTMEEFKKIIHEVRLIEKALGTGEKVPTESELKKQKRLRRGQYQIEHAKTKEKDRTLWLRPQKEEAM